MQAVEFPHARLPRIVGAVAFACAAAGCVGLGVATPHLAMIGWGLAVLAAFVAFGFWLVDRREREGVAAMHAGAVLGSWGGEGRARVDVGATLAVVDGKPRLFHVNFRRATGVRLSQDEAGGTLRLDGVGNDGNGDLAFSFELPVAPADLGAARACGHALAEHFGVGFSEGPPEAH